MPTTFPTVDGQEDFGLKLVKYFKISHKLLVIITIFISQSGCNNQGTNCLFGDSSPPCPSGGCQPPADTKIEFNFAPQGSSAPTWYDISLVDGYSQPMKIVPRGINQGSCIPTTCALSLNACPPNENNGLGDLRVFKNGQVVACLSPCKKWYE